MTGSMTVRRKPLHARDIPHTLLDHLSLQPDPLGRKSSPMPRPLQTQGRQGHTRMVIVDERMDHKAERGKATNENEQTNKHSSH